MSTLQDILNLNPIDDLSHQVVISNRLLDDSNSPIKFQIKPLLLDDFNRLKKKASFINKAGEASINEAYLNSLCIIECTLNPNFKDASSIAKFNLATPEQYLNKVLLAGEADRLIKEIFHISGFIDDFEGFVEEIKN
ncbi:MAG: XkdN-like protein [bacterium]